MERVAGDVLRTREQGLREKSTAASELATVVDPPRRSRFRRGAGAVAALAFLGALAMAWVNAQRSPAPAPEHPSTEPRAAELRDEPTAPAIDEPSELLTEPAKNDTSSKRHENRSDAPPARARTQRPSPRRTQPAKAPDSCDPPSFFDENGRIRYKRWCPL